MWSAQPQRQKQSALHHVRCCLCGDSGVGKSTLVRRYMNDTFDSNIESTIGAAYQQRRLDGCVLHLWDTAGQERYQALCPMYLRQGDIVLIAAEAAAPHTAGRWIERSREINDKSVLVLVATKGDRPAAPGEMAALREWAEKRQVHHVYRVSSKTGDGCNELFATLERLAQDLAPACPPPGAELPVVGDPEDASGCCVQS